MIIMRHPETKGVIRVPESSQKVYERSGWEVDDKSTKAIQEEPGLTDANAGPVTDKEQARLASHTSGKSGTQDQDTGEAGPRSGSRTKSASGTKEEGK